MPIPMDPPQPPGQAEIAEVTPALAALAANLNRVIRGREETIRLMLAVFLAGGHVLLEDLPGTGKTTLAKALARSLGARFTRVQFTPDLLPSDILGVSVFDQKSGAFHFHEGPVFTQILLADEINRASPRTQSALLEAMAEGQVSVEKEVRPLPRLFFVIATQNPVEFHGTYPLPEAQMDRFGARFSLGYLSLEEEVAVVADRRLSSPLETLHAAVDADGILRARDLARRVAVERGLLDYAVGLVQATRVAAGVRLGASPRASMGLVQAAQALALLHGRAFVIPEYLQALAVPVVAHRLGMDPQARFAGKTAEGVVREIMAMVQAPV